jgi:hypothetical protein
MVLIARVKSTRSLSRGLATTELSSIKSRRRMNGSMVSWSSWKCSSPRRPNSLQRNRKMPKRRRIPSRVSRKRRRSQVNE